MPSSLPAPYRRCAFTYFVEGYPCTNIFFYTFSGTANHDSAQDTADTFHTAMLPLYRAVLSVDVIISGTSVIVRDNSDSFEASVGEPITVHGMSAGGSLPGQDAAILTRHVGILTTAGRVIRGRIFLSGIDEAKVSVGEIDPTYMDDIQAVGQGAMGLFDGESMFSPKNGALVPITGYTVPRAVKTIRRRRQNS